MDFVYSYELDMDFQNLISCIECHVDAGNEQVILETLKTITDLCANESCAKDMFREVNGLDFLVEFVFTTNSTVLLEHSLKALAFVIDENFHSQIYLTKKAFFEVIQSIVRNHTLPVNVKKNSILLASAVLYQNSTAQNLVYEVGLIEDMLCIFEQGAQKCSANSLSSMYMDDISSKLWLSTSSALSFCVNNPQNERNQEKCSEIFPIAFKVLESSCDELTLNSVSSLLSLVISNNKTCQNKLHDSDALLMLTKCFKKYVYSVISEFEECNEFVGKSCLQAINNILGIISVAAMDHERNASLFGKLEAVSLMAKLLFVETLDTQMKTRIILCLGHCLGACSSNKEYVLQTDNFDKLLKNFLLEDTELSFASKYLLVCLFSNESLENMGVCIAECNEDLVSVNAKSTGKSKPQSHSSRKTVFENKKRLTITSQSSCMLNKRVSIRNNVGDYLELNSAAFPDNNHNLKLRGTSNRETTSTTSKVLFSSKPTFDKISNQNACFKLKKSHTSSESAVSSYHTISCVLGSASCVCKQDEKQNYLNAIDENKEDVSVSTKPMMRHPVKPSNKASSRSSFGKMFCFDREKDSDKSSESEDSLYNSLKPQSVMNKDDSFSNNKSNFINVTQSNQVAVYTSPPINTHRTPSKHGSSSIRSVKKRPLSNRTNLTSFTKKLKLDPKYDASNLSKENPNNGDISLNLPYTPSSMKRQGKSNSSKSPKSLKSPRSLNSPGSCGVPVSFNRKRNCSKSPSCSQKSKLARRSLEDNLFSDDSSETDSDQDFSGFIDVIVLPGEQCKEHNLLSTIEKLQVVSLK